jgi:hypothetical protein
LCFNVQLSGCSRCTVLPRFLLWGGAMFDCRLDCHIEACKAILSVCNVPISMHKTHAAGFPLLSTDFGFVMSPFPGPARGRRAVHTGVRRNCAVGGRWPDRGAVFDVVMGGATSSCISARERRPAPTKHGNGFRGNTPSVRQAPPNGLADQIHTSTCCDRFLGECCIILQVERNEFRGGTKP